MDHPALAILRCAFDEAARRGERRPVWWRDDDAVDTTPALDALGRLASRHGAPLALAVIPEGATASLLARAAAEGWAVLQHGVAHHNHQPSGKPAELGDGRAVEAIVADCLTARARIEGAATHLPVMVPPWNRMRADLAAALAVAGWRGVSLWGEAPSATPLRRVDTHIDPVAWHGDRGLLAAETLAAMAERAVATGGPIGVLTHHLVHTAAVTDFADALAALVARHPGARWAGAAELFGDRRMNPFTPIEALLEAPGALFGLDYGTKTIGIAVSDAGWRIASPLETIRRGKFTTDAQHLFALADRWSVVAFVIGMPFNMDGSSGTRVQSTRDFARNLGKLTDRPLVAWDERWSTVAAERAMLEADASRAKRRAAIDKVAAALILQGALDRLRILREAG